MSVYTLGAVPAPRALNLRRKPSAARTTSVATRVAPSPTSSRTGLPGALAPPVKTLNLRKRPSMFATTATTTAGSTLPKRRLPGSAPSPAPSGSGIASGGEYGRYDDGGDRETFVPVPSGGGGGGFVVPASAAEPSDGIPMWAAIGGIALCAVVGFALLQRQGIV